MSRDYPDEVAGHYEPPPRTFVDRAGRDLAIRRYDGEYDALVEMYLAFDPEDRAQGIPPTDAGGIREWLDTLLDEDCVNVVAWHEAPVGHALLVPDRHGDFELAIFVLREYQEAGIGTELVEGLLGAGREDGVERVWLTVERWNTPATVLYRKVGFESSDEDGLNLEMTARLVDRED